MAARILTDDERRSIAADYQQGMGFNALMKKYKSTSKTLRKVITGEGIQIRGVGSTKERWIAEAAKRWTEQERKSIADDYQNGIGFVALQTKYKSTSKTLRRVILEQGVQIKRVGSTSDQQRQRRDKEEPSKRDESQKKRDQLKGLIPDSYHQLPLTPGHAKELGENRYFNGNPCSKGHLSPRKFPDNSCYQCFLENQQKARETPESKEKTKQAAKARWADPEKRKKQEIAKRQWAEENIERVRAMRRTSYNKHWKTIRMQRIKKQRERYWKDPSYRLRKSLARSIQTKIKYQSEKKKDKTLELTGCSIKELKAHLETNFRDGMSWDNYKHDGWHMDHIRPCASFDLTDKKQQFVCFNWRNLAPVWANENIIKSDTYEPIDEVEWSSWMVSLGFESDLFLMYEEGRGGL